MTVSLSISSSRVAGTYSELQDLIAAYLNRSDLTERIPTFIELFERRANRTLISPEREISLSASVSDNYTLPSDFYQLRAAYIDSDPRRLLEQVTLSELHTRFASQATGMPAVFALSGGAMLFGPVPDGPYQLSLTYYRNIPLLGDDMSSNWLLESHPDIYLYGSLLQAMAYLKNDSRVPLWNAALEDAVRQLEEAGNRKRYSAAPLRLRSPVCA